jgi:uncharacterized protein
MKFLYGFVFTFLFLFSGTINCQEISIPAKPEIETSLYDFGTGILSPAEYDYLKLKLLLYADRTSTQIVIVLIKTTGGIDIDQYKVDLANSWGIGQAGKDNGVLILVAVDDRKVAIATGKGVEHVLTDAECAGIINYDIVPEFKKGDYYAGLDKAVSIMILKLGSEFKEDRGVPAIAYIIVVIIALVIIVLIGMFLYYLIKGMRKPIDKNAKYYYHSRVKEQVVEKVIIIKEVEKDKEKKKERPTRLDVGFRGGFGGGKFGGGGASGSW